MTKRSMLVLSMLIPVTVLCCIPRVPDDGWHECICTDAEGNKSYVLQDAPCDNQPMGSGRACDPMQASGSRLQDGAGGAGGEGGSGEGGHP